MEGRKKEVVFFFYFFFLLFPFPFSFLLFFSIPFLEGMACTDGVGPGC